jgi:hypothetical protein
MDVYDKNKEIVRDLYSKLLHENYAKDLEIDRLREALRKVADFDLYGDFSNAYKIPEIARAALNSN